MFLLYVLLQVGMMLRGMGFDNTTLVYVAAGKIYKSEKFMAPLKLMFPRLETKDTLATPEELSPFKVSKMLLELSTTRLSKELHPSRE